MNIKEILQGIKSWAVGKFGSAADVAAILGKIPTQASTSNQLADKAFVNSSVQTGTANFRGSWPDFADVPTDISSYPKDYAGSKKPTVNDYMVVLDTMVYEWEQGASYLAGDVVSNGYYGFFRALEDMDSQIQPADAPELWEQLPYSWYESVGNSGGTWRFKYTGNWDVNGINGWVPEYKINDKPLTAAQIAALNSNITAALTRKLQGLPSKPVDTAAQTLTDEQKAQARTNIGATAPEVFWAVYGTTTVAQIDAAVAAGKLVMCKDNSGFIYLLVSYDVNSNNIGFLSGYSSATRYVILKRDTGNWIGSSLNLQIVNNLVTSWQPTPDNTHYPAEKLVKDSLDAITPFVGIYNSTTFAEISAALTAGKEVWINRNGRLYAYSSGIADEYSYYTSPAMGGTDWLRLKNATNDWAANVNTFQNVSSKVTSLSASSTNNEYPSAKCVYDNLYKPGKVSQTITWSGSGANAEYTLSDIVTGNIPVTLIEEAAAYGVNFNTTTGYFEYGGYTDIAADEMREAIAMRVAHIMRQAYQSYEGRIILPPLSAEDGAVSAFYNVKYVKYIPACIITDSRSLANNQFAQSKKLEEVDFIIGGYSWPTTPFGACESLKSFKVNALIVSISVPDSPLITVECIKYIVDKRTNTASPVTITLHATAYARMAADTTEYTYGGQTYTGIVAYANAKNITIASA